MPYCLEQLNTIKMKGKKGFTKNDPNINTDGRKKGAKDKFKQETKRRIDKVLTQLEETLEDDIKALLDLSLIHI